MADSALDHCIDSLRQLIMCRADATFQTYDWIPDLRIPWANFEVEHECINWDRVDDWAGEHAIDVYEFDYLIHPDPGVLNR